MASVGVVGAVFVQESLAAATFEHGCTARRPTKKAKTQWTNRTNQKGSPSCAMLIGSEIYRQGGLQYRSVTVPCYAFT